MPAVTSPQPWPRPDDDGFDEIPWEWLRARAGTKWSSAGPGVVPAWVADMDFPAPRVAREAVERLALAADFGYPRGQAAGCLEELWLPRMEARMDWAPAPGRVRAFTDLVQAVEAVLHVGTSPGDGVLLLTPSYPVFVRGLAQMGRRLLEVPAVPSGDGWEFDLERARVAAPGARALLLVNPHNPTGRVLSRPELESLAQTALDHDLLVISDEVHADLLLSRDAHHIPFASLAPEVGHRTVTLYSASKSFNLGGMCCALAHIGAGAVAQGLDRLPQHLLGHVGRAGLAATLACWSAEGDRWLERCLERLRANRDQIGRWLAGPGARAAVKGHLPQATYLQWLDLSQSGPGPQAVRVLADQAQLMLSPGTDFGPGGEGFVRLNFATSPAVLTEILQRAAAALGPGRH